MRKTYTILIIILLLQNIFGQQGPLTSSLDMYPKSPDATSLSKYIDIPAGNYTGVANFSIPIYSITIDGNIFPIELNYSTTGIKVSQVSGRVGLGWALNTGGISLSEQVVGVRDFAFRTNLPEDFNPNAVIPTEADQSIAGEMTDETGPYQEITPDVYTYSTPNASGRFIFDSDKSVGIPMPYNQMKIIKDSNADINIIDDKGINYQFLRSVAYFNGNTCTTRVGPINRTMSYFPSKATTPQGKNISFEYRHRQSSDQAVFVNSLTEQKVIDHYTTPLTSPTHILTPPYCYNYSRSYEELLSKINFPGGVVYFYYNDEIDPNSMREDLPKDKFLKKVVVKNMGNEVIKDYTFNYSYFTSDDNFELIPPIPEIIEGINKRLKLTEVVDNLTGGKYQLSYYEDYSLPNRLSYSQDWWGVYNGKNNNQTSIPTVTYSKLSGNGEMVRYLELGADKFPDFNYGVMGNLKKIKYPTGGYTQIDYEADTFSSEFPFEKKIYVYSYKDATTSDFATTSVVNFTILANSFPAKITFDGSDDDDQSGGNEFNKGKIRLYKLGPQTTIVFNTTVSGEYEKKLDPGNYKMEITSGIDADFIPVDCSGMIEWYTEADDPDFNGYQTGTIRVAKIESVDENNQKISRKFTYLNPERNYNVSSGKNQGQVIFSPLKKNEYPGNLYGATNSKTVIFNNQAIDSQISGGKPVAYSYVQEIYSSPTNEYKKEYNFFNEDVLESRNPNSLLYTGWPDKDQRNGLLISETLFDDNNNRIKKTVNEYEFDDFFNSRSTAYKQTIPHRINGITNIYIKSINCLSLGCVYEYVWSDDQVTNYWVKNKKTTITEFIDNQPTISFEDSLNYSISPQHVFPIKKITNNSVEEIFYTQNYKYAHENGNTDMIAANMVGIPLETEVKKYKNVSDQNPKTISKSGFNYTKRIFAGKELILPEVAFGYDLQYPSTATTDIKYNEYDDKGNLLQYTLKPDTNGSGGIPVSIIWGYNQTQPIAKIEGATYAQVAGFAAAITTASDSDASQATNNDETSLLLTLDTFRKNLSNFQVTTYTYDSLIGVRSITPPSGIREYYIYDTANRLQSVKDINGKILKEYKYNYKP